MHFFSSTQIKFFFVLLLLGSAVSIQAIVVRHDRADSRYQVEERDYPQVFYIDSRYGNKICVGTLISPQWAITAAHCTDQTPLQDKLNDGETYRLSIAGNTYEVSQLEIHPKYAASVQSQVVDLALLKLDRAVQGVDVFELYRNDDEINQVISILGWGYTGRGTVGRRGNDGRLRRAQNTVEKANQWLHFRFDDPRQIGNRVLELEGVPGLGDSGGPAFLENIEGNKLMGVAIGEITDPLRPEAKQGEYGATEVYERISTHLTWIDGVLQGL